ncbi:MAG: aminotransferase class I/II-fold pyridoxal phosphate-dependent enzyme, partial [Angelakisella sp.]
EHTLQGELATHKNLVILKAFTKCYAMAGLRLGYILCGDDTLTQRLREAGQPWAVSNIAQAAGEAALLETQYIERLRACIAEGRPQLMRGLASLGGTVYAGEANYLLFSHSDRQLAQKLRKNGVLVRDCANYIGLGGGWYRVAIRTEQENNRLLQAMKEVL